MRLPRVRFTVRRSMVIALLALLALYVLVLWPRGDLARLQGSWSVIAVEADGVSKPATLAKLREGYYVFSWHRFNRRYPSGPVDRTLEEWVRASFSGASVSLDPAASPKAIDVSFPDGMRLRGIYELSGDRLKICLPWPGSRRAPRPARFPDPGPEYQLLVLRRRRE